MLFRTIPNLEETLVGEHKYSTDTHDVMVNGYTIRNKRDKNEDALCVGFTKNNVLVVAVCDGLGGHPDGEKASHLVTGKLDAFKEIDLTPENIRHSVVTVVGNMKPDLNGIFKDFVLIQTMLYGIKLYQTCIKSPLTSNFQAGALIYH